MRRFGESPKYDLDTFRINTRIGISVGTDIFVIL